MPPGGKLSNEDINTLVKWVEMGSPWPANSAIPAEKTKKDQPYDWDKFRKEHWAFRAIEKPVPPVVNNTTFSHSPIDQFVAAAQEAYGLQPNGPAAKRTLIHQHGRRRGTQAKAVNCFQGNRTIRSGFAKPDFQ